MPRSPVSHARQADAPPAPEARRAVCWRFHQAVELIGRRWTGAILHVLFQGPARFSVIGGALPEMTDRMLSERLRELEAAGLVARTVVPTVPVRVEYALTEKARDLTPALEELAAWAHRWLPAAEGEQDAHTAAAHTRADTRADTSAAPS
jgi:DNA-binding HxlR family transcriptional regulator